MAVTAALVKELREMTGAGMMDCKKALVETDGNIDKAVEVLREKGLSKAAKKSDRIAAMGLVRIAYSEDAGAAALVEVNSETDFVSKNEEFVTFVEKIAEIVLANDVKDIEELKAVKYSDENTVGEELTNKIATIGENLTIRRFEKFNEDGVVYRGYIHSNGMIGVVVGLQTEADKEAVSVVGKDVAMQVASMNPKFLNEDGVDPEYIAHETEILRQQVLNEGKPEAMVDKIVAGKIKKEIKEVCLVEQKFVKNGDLTVAQYVEEVAKEVGKSIAVASMTRYEVGEGIEKKQEDFAAEVAAQQAAAAAK
ncbi:MAG: translation elongation factor Ts [Eubacteriales bacterium]|nr:translation elongation factor Ts [Eubacteriales bacterium]MDY3333038.1 translation elongation factor Ts [Gallibacter sp.]